MTPRLFLLLPVIALFTCSCSSWKIPGFGKGKDSPKSPEKKSAPAGDVTSFDTNQARWIEDQLTLTPELKDRFTVTPRADDILIELKDDITPGNETLFLERAKAMKEAMAGTFRRPVNTLVFKFPSREIKI